MKKFRIEIITPEKIAFSGDVDMVSVPTASGIIGVLADHTPLFTRLVEGELKIQTHDKEIFLAIGSGFMEVNRENSTILVTSAYHADELNEKEILAAKERAENALKNGLKGFEYTQTHAMFQKSLAELKVLRRRKQVPVKVS